MAENNWDALDLDYLVAWMRISIHCLYCFNRNKPFILLLTILYSPFGTSQSNDKRKKRYFNSFSLSMLSSTVHREYKHVKFSRCKISSGWLVFSKLHMKKRILPDDVWTVGDNTSTPTFLLAPSDFFLLPWEVLRKHNHHASFVWTFQMKLFFCKKARRH